MTDKILIILLLLFSISCADVKTSSYFSPPTSTIGNYTALEIHDFVSATESMGKKSLTKIPEILENKLSSQKTPFSIVKHGEITNQQSETVIVLLGEITEYIPSSDIRYEGGKVKFGEVTINVSIALVEKSTGKELSSGEVNSFSSLGMFGGGDEKLYNKIADEVVNFILENS